MIRRMSRALPLMVLAFVLSGCPQPTGGGGGSLPPSTLEVELFGAADLGGATILVAVFDGAADPATATPLTTDEFVVPAGGSTLRTVQNGAIPWEGNAQQVYLVRLTVESDGREALRSTRPLDTAAVTRITFQFSDFPDLTPVVSFASSTLTIAEGGTSQVVTVNASPAPQSPIDVVIATSGTPEATTADYTILGDAWTTSPPGGTVRIAAGASSATFEIQATEDSMNEGDETVTFGLFPDSGDYTVDDTADRIVVTIDDNDDTPLFAVAPSDDTSYMSNANLRVQWETVSGFTDGTVYLVLAPFSAPADAPSVDQIKAGQLADGSAALATATVAVAPSTEYQHVISPKPYGLDPLTTYRVFAYGESDDGALFSSVVGFTGLTSQDPRQRVLGPGMGITSSPQGSISVFVSAEPGQETAAPDLYWVISDGPLPLSRSAAMAAIDEATLDGPAIVASGVQSSISYSGPFSNYNLVVDNLTDGSYTLTLLTREPYLSGDEVPDLQTIAGDFTIAVDDTPPAFDGGFPSATLIKPTAFDFEVSLSEPATVYVTVLDDGAGAPSAADIVAAPDFSSNYTSGTVQYTIDSLTADTSYDVWLVAEDDADNRSAPVKLDVALESIAISNVTITPDPAPWGSAVTISADVATTSGTGTIGTVTADLSAIGGQAAATLTDDGSEDLVADDGTFQREFVIPAGSDDGTQSISVSVSATNSDGIPIQTVTASDVANVDIEIPLYTITAEAGSSLIPIAGETDASNIDNTLSGTQAVTLPFDVRFYGVTYPAGTELSLSDNGGVSFNGGGSAAAFVTTAVPSVFGNSYTAWSAAPGIAVHHNQDIDADGTVTNRGIWIQTSGSGSSREFAIEWVFTNLLGTIDYAFQLRFYETTTSQDFAIAYFDVGTGSQQWGLSAFTDQSGQHTTVSVGTAPVPATPIRWRFSWE